MNSTEENIPTIIHQVEHAIQTELGDDFSLGDFITAEKIAACNALVQKASDDFFTEALGDLEALEELAHGTKDNVSWEKLRTSIYNIKSFAKVLGFTLITETCVHCLAAIDSETMPSKKKRALVSELVKMLRITFDHRIRDDGGVMGAEMLASLRSLR